MDNIKLPPLPKHSAKATDMFGTKTKLYNAQQMREYALTMWDTTVKEAAGRIHAALSSGQMPKPADMTKVFGDPRVGVSVNVVRDRFERCVSTLVPAEYANGYREALDHVERTCGECGASITEDHYDDHLCLTNPYEAWRKEMKGRLTNLMETMERRIDELTEGKGNDHD